MKVKIKKPCGVYGLPMFSIGQEVEVVPYVNNRGTENPEMFMDSAGNIFPRDVLDIPLSGRSKAERLTSLLMPDFEKALEQLRPTDNFGHTLDEQLDFQIVAQALEKLEQGYLLTLTHPDQIV